MSRFTVETAQIAAQRSVASRANARLLAAQRPPVQPAIAQPSLPAEVQTRLTDDYANRRLKRVREQLDRLDAMMLDEDDPKRLKEYADASARLSDQEFKLAGRPSPGSRRPAQDKAPSAQDAGAWIMDVPPATTPPTTQPQSNTSESSGVIRGDSANLVKDNLHVSPSHVHVTPDKPLGWEYDCPAATASLEPSAQVDRLPGDVTP